MPSRPPSRPKPDSLYPPNAAPAVQKAPPLDAFRASLQSKGKPLSQIVVDERNESRY